tara:strand:+ start:10789 stop:11409 length:621 start_codon:yes stop_codon:yes gene_type:complete
MKEKCHLKLMKAIFIYFLFISFNSMAQEKNDNISKKTVQWYNGYDWLNGLQLKPHQSIDQKEFARQYHANKAWWDIAFEYMRVTNLEDVEPGIFPIHGKNVYVIITEGPGKNFEQGKWESHRHYSDIQYVIKGKEWMGIAPPTSLTVTEPYDDPKDIAFYTGEGKYYIGDPEQFFIFFPQNAHRPGIKVNDDAPVKKIVIKVRTGE